jgi:hypothetical protein
MDSGDIPNFGLIRAQERITEDSKNWSIGPRIMWCVYLALGLLTMILGTLGAIPNPGNIGSLDLQISILHVIRTVLGI